MMCQYSIVLICLLQIASSSASAERDDVTAHGGDTSDMLAAIMEQLAAVSDKLDQTVAEQAALKQEVALVKQEVKL